ncbi:MAG: DUF2283 domain-containing protein [Egibacteraceae bacterium]
MRLEYDADADALYVRLRDTQAVARSEQVEPGTIVDLDRFGSPIGLEILSPFRPWAIDDLVALYDIDPAVVAQLREAEPRMRSAAAVSGSAMPPSALHWHSA